jgi:aminoglycoside phosphotransferase (APT) family kinase protein
MTPSERQALQILESEIHRATWDIKRPRTGNHDAFIATHGTRQVFLKFDVDAAALNRLAELHVAPALLGSGVVNNRSYIIQEYIGGGSPDRAWFPEHIPDLARFIKRYHADAELTRLLASAAPISYADHVRRKVARLARGMQRAQTAPLRTSQAAAAFRELAQQAKWLSSAALVPTHADPNHTNFLIVRDHFCLIDWDDISLSDPLRDIGLLLWWYMSHEQWPEFFSIYGVAIDDALLHNVYWWSAYASLSVAQWFDTHRQDEARVETFLLDFYAALNRQENPHTRQ